MATARSSPTLRELAVRRAEQERKSFSQRPDAARWRDAFAAKEAHSDRWAREMAGLFSRFDSKLKLERGIRAARKAWEDAARTVRKAEGETPPPPPPPAPVYGAILAAGGEEMVGNVLAGGVKVEDYAEGAMAMYLKLALDVAEEAGELSLKALGLGETWDWATYRDFARDEYAVRGSKILQHAYGAHLSNLTRLVIRKCDPRHPLTIQELTKQIRTEWSRLARYEAERIARTEAAAVWERMNYYALEMNGVAEVEWLIAQGPALEQGKVGPVCPACLKAKADGPYPVKGKGSLTEETMPPRHPNCFPAGTLVNGPAPVGAIARAYSGDIVTIRTAHGHRLTVTPNHPVLTPDGWQPVGVLRCGDYLIRDVFHERMRSSQNDHDRPARIEEIAQTFAAERFGYIGESAVEFHGDASHGEIYVVRSDRSLQRHVSTASSDPSREAFGVLCDRCLPEFVGLSASQLLLQANRSPTSGDVRRSSLGGSLFRGHGSPLEPFSFRSPTLLKPTRVETFDDGPTGYPEALRQSIDRHSFVVQPDKIVDVDCYSFTGHVYNLETIDNWYSANGIIVHNCRCHLVPVLKPGWLPPAQPFEGIKSDTPPVRKSADVMHTVRQIRAVASSEPEPVAKSVGWAAPPVPKAPVLRSPLVAAVQGRAAGRKPLTAAQLAQRRAAARRKKGRRAARP